MRRRLPNVTGWWIVGPIAQVLSRGAGIGGSMELITRQEGASREERCARCGLPELVHDGLVFAIEFRGNERGREWTHVFVPPKEAEA